MFLSSRKVKYLKYRKNNYISLDVVTCFAFMHFSEYKIECYIYKCENREKTKFYFYFPKVKINSFYDKGKLHTGNKCRNLYFGGKSPIMEKRQCSENNEK